MDYFNILAGGAAVGVIASCWGYIKGFFWKIASTLIQRVEVTDTGLARTLVSHLVTHYPHSRVYDRVYGAGWEYIKKGKHSGSVPYEQLGQRSLILWNGWAPFIVNRGTAQSPYHEKPLTLTFMHGTLDMDALVAVACQEQNERSWSFEKLEEREQKRFFVRYVPDIQGKTGEERAGRCSTNGIPWYHEGQYRTLGYRPEELGRGQDADISALDLLIFPARVLTLIEEIKLWRNHREWHQKRGIPWKRGWLLYGPPGTGKTALARAFAEDLDMPIFVYNLSELGNFQFMRAWLAMQSSAPCVALIEDIDNVFHGRENVSRMRPRSFMSLFNYGEKKEEGDNSNNNSNNSDEAAKANGTAGDERERSFFSGGTLSFDVLLNMLDGVDRNDGVFTIITTNDISKIDPALGKPRRRPDGALEFISTRPGRIDKAIELTYLEPDDKRRMAQRILGEYPQALAEVLDFVDGTPLDETPAQFQERCAQIALRCFWEEQTGQTPAAETAPELELVEMSDA
ncbi:MAG: AAA family ATPase [Planctomycetia bacterium]|nr:AAA family ATPase [Planctomycetia bacterium]